VRPIRLVVPLPAGGGNDIIARLVAAKVTQAVGQQVVVDNRPGGGGSLGAELVARATPDGYTLLLGGVGSHAINPVLHSHIRYDAVRDFTPISLVASSPLLLVINPTVPARSVKELVALARAKPGGLNLASLGYGSSAHLAGELFMMLSETRFTHVPYNQAPPVAALVAGEVQLMFSSALRMLPLVRGEKLRALAVTTAQRSSTMPDIPTIAESGVPGYETSSWYGILGPAGLTQDVSRTLSGEIAKLVQLPDVRAQLSRDAADPIGSSPAEFTAMIKRELARWQQVVARAGLKVD
jgi:tripartite-type tricarboxylate transporter receptor subunit TctC